MMRAKERSRGVFDVFDEDGDTIVSNTSEDYAEGFINGWRHAQGGDGYWRDDGIEFIKPDSRGP